MAFYTKFLQQSPDTSETQQRTQEEAQQQPQSLIQDYGSVTEISFSHPDTGMMILFQINGYATKCGTASIIPSTDNSEPNDQA
jgi:hypothetical protein